MKILRVLVVILTAGFIFSSCQKEFTIEAITAKGSLQKDSSGNCMPGAANGVYAKDSLLKASNFVDISVKITQTGSYSIKTDTVNGYSFTAAGDVGVIGVNTIRLVGKGRPIVGGVDVFKIKFDSSICEFDVIVSGTGGGGGGGTSNDSIVATIDGVYKTFNFLDSSKRNINSGYNLIGIQGDNNLAGDESFGLLVGTVGPLIPGTYTVNQFPVSVLGAQYSGATFDYFAQTDPTGPQTPGFTITISSLTANKVVGTFFGRLKENQGAGPGFKDVTGGKFSVTIYP